MSDTSTQTETETPEGLRAAKAASDATNASLAAENARLKKEALFHRAGIDVNAEGKNGRVAKMLFDRWDGDKLDDLVKEANELELIQTVEEQTATPQQQQQQQMGEMFRGGPAGGGAKDPSQGPDPKMEMLTTFRQAQQQDGETVELAQMKALGQYLNRVNQGDPRTRFNKHEHAEAARAADAAMFGSTS